MTTAGASGAKAPHQSILIIEDDADIRESLQLALESAGYTIDVAGNGEEGLRKLQAIDRPALILLDLMMPIMNGLEFLAARRADQALASIPVVLVTAYGHLGDHATDLAGLVRKPIDLDELLRIVSQYCGP